MASRLSLFPHPAFSQCAACEWASSWEGTRPGQLTPTNLHNIPCHMTSCSVIKPEVGGGRLLGRQPLLRNWLGICLLVGGGE